jgi:nitronate monooxygenase
MLPQTWLTENFNLKLPVILAPMFLISNEKMLEEAGRAGIMGCVPALNYRSPELLAQAIESLKKKKTGPFGINLIVNKSNYKLAAQLDVCLDLEPDFILTSLGSPQDVIQKFRSKKTKIFCDVHEIQYAKKVEEMGADALIAINSGAGGHLGKISSSVFLPKLKRQCKIPVISAGGVGTGEALLSVLSLGAEGASVGSPFIPCMESPVSPDYKKACLDYEAEDIVLTTKISGIPCTIIETPYVKKIGTKQNFIEAFLNQYKNIKKYIQTLTYLKGIKSLEKAAFNSTYKTVWCAGQSIDLVREMKPIGDIVQNMKEEYEVAYDRLKSIHSN